MLFPEKTEFKKRIPKQKFYTNMEITSNLKKAFVEQIKIIYWQNKLTSTTLNIDKGKSVLEIEVIEIKLNNNLLGLTDLEGEGVEITLQDDPNATVDSISVLDQISNHLVHDSDIRMIVNELKNAGAEAISINGQRVVSTTSIICIGNVIKVNDARVSSPFVIKAIGFPERLMTALDRPGGFLEELNSYGIVTSMKKSSKVEIPKYSGVISAKYMRTQE